MELWIFENSILINFKVKAIFEYKIFNAGFLLIEIIFSIQFYYKKQNFKNMKKMWAFFRKILACLWSFSYTFSVLPSPEKRVKSCKAVKLDQANINIFNLSYSQKFHQKTAVSEKAANDDSRDIYSLIIFKYLQRFYATEYFAWKVLIPLFTISTL